MSFDENNGWCNCERCAHTWTAKSKDGFFACPAACAKCKSKVWNTPRVYAGKYISGVMAKRFKPTGRAAAKLRQEFLDEVSNIFPPLHPACY